MSSSRKAASPGPVLPPSSTPTRRSGNVTWECDDMSYASDPAIDAAYAPRRALPPGVFEAHMDLYRDRSAEAYRTLPNHRDLCYDPASGQCLDVFPAPGTGLKPVFVFIHGGY